MFDLNSDLVHLDLFLKALCEMSYDGHFVYVFLHVGEVSNDREVFDMLPNFVKSLCSNGCRFCPRFVNRQKAFELFAVIR